MTPSTTTKKGTQLTRKQIDLLVGDDLQVKRIYNDEKGRDIHIAVSKTDQSTLKIEGPETSGLTFVRDYPKFAKQLGFSIKNAEVHMPGNASSLNSYLNEFNEKVPEEEQLHIRMYDHSGKIARKEFAVKWAEEGIVVYSDRGGLHFHDLCVHFRGYMAMPMAVIERSRKNMKLLLNMQADSILKKNELLQRAIETEVSRCVDKLDNCSHYAAVELDLINAGECNLTRIKSKWNQTIPDLYGFSAFILKNHHDGDNSLGTTYKQCIQIQQYAHKSARPISDEEVAEGVRIYFNRIYRFS